MVRGKAIVRDRRMMRRPRPKLFLTQPESSRAMNTIAGTECCCGTPPPCTDPCTAFGCEYCPNDELTTMVSTYIKETWAPSAGGPQRPPCNHFLNGCPGKPGPCDPLDVLESYDGLTGISVQTHTAPVARNISGPCGSFGNINGSPTLAHRQQLSGRLNSVFNGCTLATPPQDFTVQRPFEFSRTNGGWRLETNGGTQFDYGLDCRNEPPQCNDRDCTADRIVADLVCALLPVDCYTDEIMVDSGCVQNRSSFESECVWSRASHHLVYHVERRA